jgi:hypothetical protein
LFSCARPRLDRILTNGWGEFEEMPKNRSSNCQVFGDNFWFLDPFWKSITS